MTTCKDQRSLPDCRFAEGIEKKVQRGPQPTRGKLVAVPTNMTEAKPP